MLTWSKLQNRINKTLSTDYHSGMVKSDGYAFFKSTKRAIISSRTKEVENIVLLVANLNAMDSVPNFDEKMKLTILRGCLLKRLQEIKALYDKGWVGVYTNSDLACIIIAYLNEAELPQKAAHFVEIEKQFATCFNIEGDICSYETFESSTLPEYQKLCEEYDLQPS